MDFFDDVKNNKNPILIISIIGNVIFIIAICIILYLYFNYDCQCDSCSSDNLIKEECEPCIKEEVNSDFYVEVKGAVNNPGVYKVNDTNIINDVVDMAGGLSNNAYTDNINLSKKVSKELVIYIYTKDDFANLDIKENPIQEVDNTCVCPSYDISSCTDDKKSEIVPELKEDEVTNESDIEEKDDTSDEVINQNNKEENNKQTNNSSSSKEETKPNVNKKVNINLASKSELTTLSGIGNAKAEKIIEYRNKNGAFKKIEDIKKVSGIGDAIYAKIKDNITV